MTKFSSIILILTAGLISNAVEVVEINSPLMRDLDAGRELRSFERLLTRLPHQQYRRAGRLNLEFGSPAAKPDVHADFSVFPWHVRVTGGRAWKSDLLLASKLGGILAAVHCGASAEDAAKSLPLWLTAALFQQEQERKSTEHYLGSNRRFPAAGALLQTGIPLNPETFAFEMNSPANSAERLWQQEFGRLLLDLSFRFSPKSFGVQIPHYKGKKFSTQSYSPEELPLAVWQNPESVPASILEREFQELQKLYISALDKEGIPSGESVEITLEQLPEKLKKHPEETVIRQLCSRRISEIKRRVPGELALPLAHLALAVKNLNDSEESAVRLKQALSSCNTAFLRRKTRSQILDEVQKNDRRLQRFAPVFSCSWTFSMLNEKEQKILNQTEQFFNR